VIKVKKLPKMPIQPMIESTAPAIMEFWYHGKTELQQSLDITMHI